jgi:hypothetical protein
MVSVTAKSASPRGRLRKLAHSFDRWQGRGD